MRWSHRLLCCVLAAGCAVIAAQNVSAQSEHATLIELERGWNDAFYRKDVDFIENLLADEFTATYDDGSRGDKARELELAAAFNQRVVSAEQEDFTVRIYGDTAVVWFTLRVVGIRQGQPAEVALSYTDVWVRRGGGWQCVSTQSTRLNAG